MDIVERYKAYADAFEETFVDDDWSRLEPFFTENASYSPGRQTATGRDAAFALLKEGIDGFDRKMGGREIEFLSMTAQGNEVHAPWRATFTRDDLPPISFSALEIARFEGDRIAELRDEWEPVGLQVLQDWMAEHGAKL